MATSRTYEVRLTPAYFNSSGAASSKIPDPLAEVHVVTCASLDELKDEALKLACDARQRMNGKAYQRFSGMGGEVCSGVSVSVNIRGGQRKPPGFDKMWWRSRVMKFEEDATTAGCGN